MRRLALSAIVLALSPFWALSALADEATHDCAAPSELIDGGEKLPALAEQLKARRPVSIVRNWTGRVGLARR